jgi:hypothetical protein
MNYWLYTTFIIFSARINMSLLLFLMVSEATTVISQKGKMYKLLYHSTIYTGMVNHMRYVRQAEFL